MKTATILLLASFIVASSLLSTPCSSVDLSTPVAAWSGSAASGASPVVHSNTVGTTELAESLSGLLGLSSSSSSSSLFSSLETAPELAVFFIEPMLSTHSFYQLTGAYNPTTSRAQPVFGSVRSQLESKKSVLAENVVLFTELSNILSALATRQLTAHITSSVLLVGPANDELSLALIAAFPHQVQHITPDKLEAHLLANPTLGSNGVTDIVIYRFAESALFHSHDAVIDSVSSTIDRLTKDSFFFLGSQSTPDLPFAIAAPHYSRIAETNSTDDDTNSTSSEYTTQFPPNVASGLITTAFLLIVLAIGVCCLCYTQTPDRFPEAIREGQVNYHLLYPAKQ